MCCKTWQNSNWQRCVLGGGRGGGEGALHMMCGWWRRLCVETERVWGGGAGGVCRLVPSEAWNGYDTGSKLDIYERAVAGERGDVLQDSAEFLTGSGK